MLVTTTTTITVKNLCELNKCLNGGKCVSISNIEFKCLCTFEFTDTFCGIKLPQNPCESSPCLNNGTCFSYDGDNELLFECLCDHDFHGDRCEEHLLFVNEETEIENDCVNNNPCLNGGICNQMISNYGTIIHCECSSEFSGQFCDENLQRDEVSPCDTNTCMNNGECINVDFENFRCVCESNFYGTLCENIKTTTTTTTKLPDLCLTNPCNSNGICTNNVMQGGKLTFWCDCFEPFYGRNCQLRKTTTTTTTTKRIHPCDQSGTCLNNGSCKRNGYSYSCSCTSDYEGSKCELKKYNPCDYLICKNSGVCVLTLRGTAKCECLPNFLGETCESKNNLKIKKKAFNKSPSTHTIYFLSQFYLIFIYFF
jgi:hypothetical protein